MMKFFVVLFVMFNDGTEDKVGIYKCATEDEAIKNFYKYMSQYVDVPNVATVTVEAKTNLGGRIADCNAYWVNPVVPEPEPGIPVEEPTEE